VVGGAGKDGVAAGTIVMVARGAEGTMDMDIDIEVDGAGDTMEDTARVEMTGVIGVTGMAGTDGGVDGAITTVIATAIPACGMEMGEYM
jgi:hypothetical protein